MVRPETNRPPFDGNGFTVAAILAPGMALAIYFTGHGLADPSIAPGEIGRFVGSLLFLLLLVSLWGALPSLIFGGLVLAVIQRIPWRGRPTALVFMIGGLGAAGLYVLAGFGTSGLSPGLALFFAPWATDLGALGSHHRDWWLVSSLLLAGAAAGLIYAAFARRG